MPSTLFIETLVTDAMVKSISRVFKTMAGIELVFLGNVDHPDRTQAGPVVVGCVGFAGAIDGLICVALPETCALDTTARILGMTREETLAEGPDAVKDAIGEVTNMTAGGFKNVLCDLGHYCILTLPTILRGSNVSFAAVRAAERHIFHFECDGVPIVVDLQMKPGS